MCSLLLGCHYFQAYSLHRLGIVCVCVCAFILMFVLISSYTYWKPWVHIDIFSSSPTPNFILVLSLSVFVAPSSDGERSDSHYLYFFIYLISFPVYMINFPSPLLPYCLHRHHPHPLWTLTSVSILAAALGCTDAPHPIWAVIPLWATFLYRWSLYPAQTLMLCAGLPLTSIPGWSSRLAIALTPCAAVLLALLRLWNYTLGWTTNPSPSLMNALLLHLAFNKPSRTVSLHLFHPLFPPLHIKLLSFPW